MRYLIEVKFEKNMRQKNKLPFQHHGSGSELVNLRLSNISTLFSLLHLMLAPSSTWKGEYWLVPPANPHIIISRTEYLKCLQVFIVVLKEVLTASSDCLL